MVEVIVISRYNEVFEVVIGWGLFNFDNSTSSPELFALGCEFNSFIFIVVRPEKMHIYHRLLHAMRRINTWQLVGG